MAKKNDDIIEAIKEAVGVIIEEKGLVTKSDLGYLPSKDQFYEETLKVLNKLDSIEMQMKMLSSRTYDNTDRIEKLQNIHPHNSHLAFA